MLTQRERNALLRLMRSALGSTLECRRIARWLLVMEGVGDVQNVPSLEYGLSTRNASDVKLISEAVRRENTYLTDLGRIEHVHNMVSIVKRMGLSVTHRGELKEWLETTGNFGNRGSAKKNGGVSHISTA
jgi:hypothetical protein